MAITLSIDTAIAANNAIVDLVDGGTVSIYTVGDVLLASFTLNTPAFGNSATDGGVPPKAVASANVTGLTATPVADGTASYYVVKTVGAAESWRGSCGLSGSGMDMILDTTAITTLVDVTIISWAFRHPTQ